MFLRELAEAAGKLKGAGPETVRRLAGLGILGVADLLCHYPRDWEDRIRTAPIAAFRHSPVNTVVRGTGRDWIGAGGMRTLKIYVEDQSGSASLVCFNRSFLEKKFIQGKQYRIWGRFFYKYGEIQSTVFEFEDASESGTAFGRILPIYSLSAGLSQGLLRRLVKKALDQYAASLEDELPNSITVRDGLLSKKDAIRAIHFPSSMEELAKARKTLIYEELFYLEIMVGKRAMERRTTPGGAASPGVVPPAAPGGLSFSPLQKRFL